MRRVAGEFVDRAVGTSRYRAFVPFPLPPKPDLRLDGELEAKRDLANRFLGRLDLIGTILPDKRIFLSQYLRKEALLSSQIEGTQFSFSDLLLAEIGESPDVHERDIREPSNYIAAVYHGISRIREGFPLSLRLLQELHAILLRKGRGSDQRPGEFRTDQNRIGGTGLGDAEYVPPPPDRMMACLDPFERFLHIPSTEVPVLIKAALAHAQFETIHPFRDGNGRVGRLLITLLLCSEEVLQDPTLYLSLYFKARRTEYYDRLQATRIQGDWEAWLGFFFDGVAATARQAVDTARQILALFDEDAKRAQSLPRIGGTALRLHQFLQEQPIASLKIVQDRLSVSHPTAAKAMAALERLGMVREITGFKRNRLFVYDRYLNILSEGTEPL